MALSCWSSQCPGAAPTHYGVGHASLLQVQLSRISQNLSVDSSTGARLALNASLEASLELLAIGDEALLNAVSALDPSRESQEFHVIIVISSLAFAVCIVMGLLMSFAPPSTDPPLPEADGARPSPRKQLSPDLVTPPGGELLTLPEWVFSELIWKENSFDFADLEGNPKIHVDVVPAPAGGSGDERIFLREVGEPSKSYGFCEIPSGPGPQAALRIHRGDGELFALLGRDQERGGFALAGCSISQRYRPCIVSGGSRPAMRVTAERDDVFVALAEGPVVRLSADVDAGLVLLGLVSLRRLTIMKESKEADPSNEHLQ